MGCSCAQVDAASRAVIEEAGYGEHFITRTGHGIGLEVHEEPYLVAGNDRPLEPGMAFSVEPGIYLPGRFGVRIEDIVVVGDDGAPRRQNQRTTELVSLDSCPTRPRVAGKRRPRSASHGNVRRGFRRTGGQPSSARRPATPRRTRRARRR